MKAIRVIFSDKGILVTTVLLLMFAACLAMFAIGMEEQKLGPGPIIDFSTMPSYVYQALHGNAPSTAAKYHCWAIFISSIVAPFVAAVMLAVKASLPAVAEEDYIVYAS